MSESSKPLRNGERASHEETSDVAAKALVGANETAALPTEDASATRSPTRAATWAGKKRPGDVDPHLDEQVRDKRLESAKMSLVVCGVSLISAAAEITSGPLRFAGALSVAAAWAFAALVLADRAEHEVPRWQRFAVYGLTIGATGLLIAALIAKLVR